MDSSVGTGFMAVFAVSGSVVFIAMQAHNRLLSSFIKKIETEIQHSTGAARNEAKKKVRFADEVTGDEYYWRRRYMSTPAAHGGRNDDQSLEGMPQNWQAMYKGILKCRNIRGYN